MINLKPTTSLCGARNSYNYPIPVYDDCDGPVWLFGYSHSSAHGPARVIRARSFEAAWGIAIDELTPIDADEVHEAYGYGFESKEELDAAVALADDAMDEHPYLVEGYELQSNATGTGIVNVGPFAWLRKMDRGDLQTVRLIIRADDTAMEQVSIEVHDDSYTMTLSGRRSSLGLSDIGEKLRKLERALSACNVEVKWI